MSIFSDIGGLLSRNKLTDMILELVSVNFIATAVTGLSNWVNTLFAPTLLYGIQEDQVNPRFEKEECYIYRKDAVLQNADDEMVLLDEEVEPENFTSLYQNTNSIDSSNQYDNANTLVCN